jgi:hypothetical protein
MWPVCPETLDTSGMYHTVGLIGGRTALVTPQTSHTLYRISADMSTGPDYWGHVRTCGGR